MKLRNKKTGEICELGSIRQYWREEKDGGMGYCLTTSLVDDGEQFIYNSLAEMMEEWEDYKPAEPLIKNEKVRKAVRAWAEAIGKKDNLVLSKNMEYHDCCIYDGNLGNTALIDFGVDLDIEENDYTLSELCGEEKSEDYDN